MKITKYKVVCSCFLALIIGFLVGYVTFVETNAEKAQVKKQPVKFKTYKIDFNNQKCSFCGCKPAEYYEFSTRKSNGATTAQYFCAACREMCRYK